MSPSIFLPSNQRITLDVILPLDPNTARMTTNKKYVCNSKTHWLEVVKMYSSLQVDTEQRTSGQLLLKIFHLSVLLCRACCIH